MKTNTIRLTEAQLHRVIKESVNRILRNMTEDVDLGQKEHMNTNGSHNSSIDKQIRALRNKLYDCSPEEEQKIQKQIDSLKKKAKY